MTRTDIKIPHHYTHERLGTVIGATGRRLPGLSPSKMKEL